MPLGRFFRGFQRKSEDIRQGNGLPQVTDKWKLTGCMGRRKLYLTLIH